MRPVNVNLRKSSCLEQNQYQLRALWKLSTNHNFPPLDIARAQGILRHISGIHFRRHVPSTPARTPHIKCRVHAMWIRSLGPIRALFPRFYLPLRPHCVSKAFFCCHTERRTIQLERQSKSRIEYANYAWFVTLRLSRSNGICHIQAG